ncbi:MAG: TPM domain-containing protein [Saprospiraceae bacterium]
MTKFFKPEDEQRIIAAIQQAESRTSGEVRVHIDYKSKGNIMEEAWKVFQRLGMEQTQARNGVLILIAPDQKQFAIIGDEGINKVVPENFWAEERNLLQTFFKRGAFSEGISLVIEQVGEKLHEYFPRLDDDVNELPDEISYN